MNPIDSAEPMRGVTNNPHPPSAEQAAAILAAAFAVDLGWGTLVWLAMTTASRSTAPVTRSADRAAGAVTVAVER